jgi:hypothetical protein
MLILIIRLISSCHNMLQNSLIVSQKIVLNFLLILKKIFELFNNFLMLLLLNSTFFMFLFRLFNDLLNLLSPKCSFSINLILSLLQIINIFVHSRDHKLIIMRIGLTYEYNMIISQTLILFLLKS